MHRSGVPSGSSFSPNSRSCISSGGSFWPQCDRGLPSARSAALHPSQGSPLTHHQGQARRGATRQGLTPSALQRPFTSAASAASRDCRRSAPGTVSSHLQQTCAFRRGIASIRGTAPQLHSSAAASSTAHGIRSDRVAFLRGGSPAASPWRSSRRGRGKPCNSLEGDGSLVPLGLDFLTFLATTVLVIPLFKSVKASPILG